MMKKGFQLASPTEPQGHRMLYHHSRTQSVKSENIA